MEPPVIPEKGGCICIDVPSVAAAALRRRAANQPTITVGRILRVRGFALIAAGSRGTPPASDPDLGPLHRGVPDTCTEKK